VSDGYMEDPWKKSFIFGMLIDSIVQCSMFFYIENKNIVPYDRLCIDSLVNNLSPPSKHSNLSTVVLVRYLVKKAIYLVQTLVRIFEMLDRRVILARKITVYFTQ
jgi:hypothetical protein